MSTYFIAAAIAFSVAAVLAIVIQLGASIL
jgi:hypothetical protein